MIPRPALYCLAALALALAALLWVKHREQAAVDADRAEAAAMATARALDAHEAADRATDAIRADDAAKADELEGAIDRAITEKPVEVRLPAGPAVGAVLERLRQRAPSPVSPSDRAH